MDPETYRNLDKDVISNHCTKNTFKINDVGNAG